jgi:hypothetical protein
MTLAIVKVLPEPVTPSSVWPGVDVADELLDRLRLIARRLIGCDEFEHTGRECHGVCVRVDGTLMIALYGWCGTVFATWIGRR